MERKLIVALLQKNIQELAMITEGFMEMTAYPSVIVQLARQKTMDVLEYINELETLKNNDSITDAGVDTAAFGNGGAVEEKELGIEIEETVEINRTAVEAEEEVPGGAAQPQTEEPFFEEDDNTGLETEEAAEIKQENIIEMNIEKDDDAEAGFLIIEEHTTAEEAAVEETDGNVSFDWLEPDAANEPQPAQPAEEEIKADDKGTPLQQSERIDNTIAGLHNNRKIDDIREAISIGDRFRFQRELFAGNGELMNKTFSKLNQMNDAYEAFAYLESKFRWKEDDDTAESFYQIVKRRFL